MAGLYLHIPFCKVKCHYCDFHFSVKHNNKIEMIDAMCLEIERQNAYLSGEQVETIYFGGGTPSLLTFNDFSQLLSVVNTNFEVVSNVEVTVECNPDDITAQKLTEFKTLGINRLSIGIQSFDSEQLAFLNRAHNADEALNAIKMAKEAGFTNITIDLIYGLPNTDLQYWQRQVETAIVLNVSHISSYCLTFETQTVFGNWLKKGKIQPLADEQSLDQFKLLTSALQSAGYEHYEISNFAKNGVISKHNSSYWLAKKYLGIGPSAHSFNGVSRQWNIANNIKYIQHINNNVVHYELELLTDLDRFNEYILTRLRTKWGIDLKEIKREFPDMTEQIMPKLKAFIASGTLTKANDVITLSQKGKFIADYITGELFLVD